MTISKKHLWPIILWGSVWGLLEASLGYVLHLISIPAVSAVIMLPLAMAVMYKIFKQTNSRNAVFCIALIAAFIKSIDFTLPLPPIKTINPMISIISQGIIGTLFISRLDDVKKRSSAFLLSAYAAAFSWRALFLLWNAVLLFVFTKGIFEHSSLVIFRFLLIDGIINAVFIFLIFKVRNRKLVLPDKLIPVFAGLSFAAAVSTEVLI